MGENDEIKTVDAVVTNEQAQQSNLCPVKQFENGLFAKGNTLGTLPKKPSRQQEYRLAFQRALSHDQIQEMATAMYLLACTGDVAAAKLVCEYTLGKPIQEVELSQSGDITPGALVINLISPNIANPPNVPNG